MNTFECLVPILNVKNFSASMDYYLNKLGFAKKWDWGTPPTFGCVVRGKIEIFLCEGSQGQPGVWMSIFLDDCRRPLRRVQKKRRDHPPVTHEHALGHS